MLIVAEIGAMTSTIKSARGMMAVVSVAVLLLTMGSMGDDRNAELVRVPVAVSLTMPFAVNVTVPPGIKWIVVLILPFCTLDTVQLEPGEALQTQVMPVSAVGKEYVMFTPGAVLGPLLVTRIL